MILLFDEYASNLWLMQNSTSREPYVSISDKTSEEVLPLTTHSIRTPHPVTASMRKSVMEHINWPATSSIVLT